MRVVAGEAKGRVLKVPKSSATRPTVDKVRDAIFNVIGDAVRDAVVLDLFSGSGAMAIEALSRGAERAELVENDRHALATIRANLELTGLADKSKVWPVSVARALDTLDGRFDLVLADPPYAMNGIHELMERLSAGDWLNPDALVVLEHGKRFEARESYGSLVRWQWKQYGDTAVSFYEWRGS